MISNGTLYRTGELFIRGDDGYERVCPINYVDTLDLTESDAKSNHDYAFFSGDREISFTVQCLIPLRLRMAIWGLTTKRQQRLVIRHMKWWKKHRKRTGKGPEMPFDDILMASIMEVGKYIKRPKRRV